MTTDELTEGDMVLRSPGDAFGDKDSKEVLVCVNQDEKLKVIAASCLFSVTRSLKETLRAAHYPTAKVLNHPFFSWRKVGHVSIKDL